jgi:hypothetical protein
MLAKSALDEGRSGALDPLKQKHYIKLLPGRA